MVSVPRGRPGLASTLLIATATALAFTARDTPTARESSTTEVPGPKASSDKKVGNAAGGKDASITAVLKENAATSAMELAKSVKKSGYAANDTDTSTTAVLDENAAPSAKKLATLVEKAGNAATGKGVSTTAVLEENAAPSAKKLAATMREEVGAPPEEPAKLVRRP